MLLTGAMMTRQVPQNTALYRVDPDSMASGGARGDF